MVLVATALLTLSVLADIIFNRSVVVPVVIEVNCLIVESLIFQENTKGHICFGSSSPPVAVCIWFRLEEGVQYRNEYRSQHLLPAGNLRRSDFGISMFN